MATVAIVGRPNVGKSTLFNRLLGVRKAVVSSSRGTTRDRLAGALEWRGVPLTLVDTGGFDFAPEGALAQAVQQQVRRALAEADRLLFVCDGQEGPVPADGMILERLRATGKPIVLAVNKLDREPVVPPEFFALGLAEPCPVSALHGSGTGELLDRLAGAAGQAVAGPRPFASVAIIGRQNVGKSSLFNALLRQERVIVHEQPGTTRDAVDALLDVRGQPLRIVDTAGVRHRRKVRDPVDTFSMSRTIEAIRRCDLALMVLDAAQGVVSDDKRIVATVCAAGRGLLLLVNKWDLVRGGRERALVAGVRQALPHAAFAPVLAVSAKTGFQVPRLLATMLRVIRAIRAPRADAACLALLERAWAAHPPPRIRGRTIRLRRVRWVPGLPARLELSVSPIGRLLPPYQHYLLKCLCAQPAFAGIPMRLVVKAYENRKQSSVTSGDGVARFVHR